MGKYIDTIPDYTKPAALDPAVAADLVAKLKYCERFCCSLSEKQCLANQAQGLEDPFSRYTTCPDCPDRVRGKTPPAPYDRRSIGLPINKADKGARS